MKNLFLTILSGSLLAISWPTYGFTLGIFIAFVPLLLMEYNLRNAKNSYVFFLSYLSFLIWNAFTTWWIWNSTIIGALFAILVNSLLMTSVFMLYHIVAKRTISKIASIFLVTIWISFEKFHQNWDFSWPWLNLGNVFSEKIKWIQWYEFTGIFGGTLWVWIVNLLLFFTILNFIKNKEKKEISIKILKIPSIILIPILISYTIYYTYEEEGTPSEVIVLQPNIDPYNEKYLLRNEEIIKLITDLTKEKITKKTEFVITPETIFAEQIGIERIKSEVTDLQNFTLEYPKLNFLCGASLYKITTDKKDINYQSNYIPERDFWLNYYNSAFLVNKNEEISLHHKSKLVVGVENMPLQSILKPVLGDIMINLGGTVSVLTTQPEPSVLNSIDNQKVAPIICYESIYGEYVTNYVKKGAEFLGILTNDAWWGNTQGHKQLLSYTRLRAIETRKSIARSANTGISAFINQRGDITQYIDYQKKGSLKGEVLLNDKQTIYTKYGDYIARISIFLSIGIFLTSVLRKRNEV
ncbi:MAG: apolipoprotein N-acyltransferase [Capnocytophaga sp.]|nr:apolipoprotein N-acyltransferase [Capnocytophaga sp.]